MTHKIVFEYANGTMPNQAEGTVDGVPFYVHARHGKWSLRVGDYRSSLERTIVAEGSDIRGGELHGWWDAKYIKPFIKALLETVVLPIPEPPK